MTSGVLHTGSDKKTSNSLLLIEIFTVVKMVMDYLL